MFEGAMQLFEEKGSALTIGFCGAGGKTTSLFALADVLYNMQQNVLITTTTKMFPAENSGKVKIVIRETLSPTDLNTKGICQWLSRIDEEGKGRAPEITEIEKVNKYANIWKLIEIDGAHRLPLKAPRPGEPVYCQGLDMVYGVIGASAFDQPVGEAWIHRLAHFTEATGAAVGERITPELVARLIVSPQGLFRDLPPGVGACVLVGQVTPQHDAFIKALRLLIDLPLEVCPWISR